MGKVAEYRYAKSKGEYEKELNLHVREMIEMLRREEVKDKLYVKAVKLSNHALQRMRQHFGVSNLATATKLTKEMLLKATRIGTVLAYDGRINVLYAIDKTAFFMSPDLRIVVTVNRYPEVSYKPLLSKIKGDQVDRESLIKMHFDQIREIERKEEQQIQTILQIEEKVRETTRQCVSMLGLVRGKGRKHGIKKIISEHNHELKIAGRKLFELKVEKRHLSKSLVALY